MIIDRKTTVFNSGCDAIVNTVNCRGVMGAGLALEFRLRYPEMFEQYKMDCKKGLVRIGELRKYESDGAMIINFPTKDHWREPSEISHIEKGLDYLVEHYKEWGISSIAIPPLGCSNGGLDFNIVGPIIHDKLKDLDIEVVICVDPGFPEGKEKEMVDGYCSSDLVFVCDYLEIGGKQKNAIVKNGQIKRFFNILGINDVGTSTYEKLFCLYYSNNYKQLPSIEEMMTVQFKQSELPSIIEELGIKGKEKSILIDNQKKINHFYELNDIVKSSTYRKLFVYFISKRDVRTSKQSSILGAW